MTTCRNLRLFEKLWTKWVPHPNIKHSLPSEKEFFLADSILYVQHNEHHLYHTAARIMSTTLKIGSRGGWLNPQLEKKFKLLYPYRNIWMDPIQFKNANNCHASANIFTIYSIFWIWMLRIGPASSNKILVFCCQYLAFLQSFWRLNLKC